MEKLHEKKVYRVQGFTCAGCAARFEQNVKELPGVKDAKVNFGASKIAVYGETSIEEVEKAGAFENLALSPEHQRAAVPKKTFWQRHRNVILSGIFLLLGWLLGEQYGERHVSSILSYSSSILIGGYRLFQSGFRNLIRLRFDMKTLMTVAILGAAAIGEWGEGAAVVILFAISEALESYSMDKARRSIQALMDIAPKEATIRRAEVDITIPIDEIQIGDVMMVKPGQKLAMDGVVIKGVSTINQAPITGESNPVVKNIHDEVYAGTLNEEGLLEVRVTKRVEDSTLAKIIHLVEEAQQERAPAQAFVDRFATYYTPAIMIIAFMIAVAPPLLFSGEWSEWIYRGLAVLVVGCPCALVISTPVSIVTAIGSAARQGVLIKGGIHLEETGALSAIAFDKTGTLTKGKPEVTDLMSLADTHSGLEVLALAAALEKGSQHPLASAIMTRAEEEGVPFLAMEVDEFMSLTGRGIQAKINGTMYYIGSPTLFAERKSQGFNDIMQELIEALQDQGKTVMVVGTDREVVGVIAVADELRERSQEVIHKLHDLGIKKTTMLTGDNQKTAVAIGHRLGIKEIQAELLPQEKLEHIKQYQQEYRSVAMIGDGVNDAPALAASTVGIAMGGAGTDTALETADIVLMADDLSKLPFTIKLSRKALSIIKQNITFSIAIKVIALLLIVPGWLTLWMAIFADMGATLIVTLNGLRLLKISSIL